MTKKQLSLPFVQVFVAETQHQFAEMTNNQVGIYFKLLLRCSEVGYLKHDMRVLRVACLVSKQFDKDIQAVLDSRFVWNDELVGYTSPVIDYTYTTAKRTPPATSLLGVKGKSLINQGPHSLEIEKEIEIDEEINQDTDQQVEVNKEEYKTQTNQPAGVMVNKEEVPSWQTNNLSRVKDIYRMVGEFGVESLSEKQLDLYNRYAEPTGPAIGVTEATPPAVELEYKRLPLHHETGIRSVVCSAYDRLYANLPLSDKHREYVSLYYDPRKKDHVVYFATKEELFATPKPNEEHSMLRNGLGYYWENDY